MFQTFHHMFGHPLNRGHRLAALGRYIAWQTKSRLTSKKIPVRFVENTRLLVARGMTGATGNIYFGLHDFADMAFVLHTLTPGDLFADIGANVGSYTVLAAGVAGASVIAAEPSPVTFAHLQDNIRLNGLEKKVQACNVAVGAARGALQFTRGLDTTNHILGPDDAKENAVSVDVVPLDELLAGDAGNMRVPAVMKIDVEGFETEVIRGANRVLRSPELLAIVMELNGSGLRYGYDEAALDRQLQDAGFSRMEYEPFSRAIKPAGSAQVQNTLYVRDVAEVSRRVHAARKLTINGVTF